MNKFSFVVVVEMLLIYCCASDAVFLQDEGDLDTADALDKDLQSSALANTAVIAGDRVSLSCVTNTFLVVSWLFSPTGSHPFHSIASCCELNPAFRQKYALSSSESESCNLVILKTTTSEAGTYACIAGFRPLKSAQVVVLASDPVCSVNNTTPTAGNSVLISCQVSYTKNLSPVLMTWTDVNGQIVKSSVVHNPQGLQTTSFILVQAKYPIMPSYTCKTTFSTPKGLVSSAANIPSYTNKWISPEISVKRTNSNVALLRKAIQSSTFPFSHNGEPVVAEASKAVDGNPGSNMYYGFCSHTMFEQSAWWAVDLGEVTRVGRVRLTSRGDLTGRLKDFYIGLTNTSPWNMRPTLSYCTVCKYYAGSPPGGVPTDIYCERAATGRYLFILLSGQDFLELCEVEVYNL